MSENNPNEITAMTAELKKEFAMSNDYVVLHVDDEIEVCEAFTELMREFGIKTISASSTDEAMKLLKAQSEKVMLIASDLKMPDIDGFRFRALALEKFASIPFCIVSAYVDRDMALKAVELKIVAFLSKPFEVDKLATVLYKEALTRLKTTKEDAELRLAFVHDSESLIEESEEILLALEQNPKDLEPLNRFYAIMHTLKGASAFFEPHDLHSYTHAYEDVLKKVQRGELKLGGSVTTLLFRGFDNIKMLFNEFRTGQHQPRDLEALKAALAISIDDQNASDARDATDTTEARDANEIGASSDSSDTSSKPKDAPGDIGQRGQEDIRVSIRLLDEFMQLSGEVTVIRNMLNKCVGAIEKKYAGDRDVGMLSELLTELHKINSGVQNKMTEIRKVPLKSVVRVLPRAIRDISRSLEKKINLQIEGEDLRVDTSISEVLNNSLLHIIKNSIDHGIEKPEVRANAGKPEIGTVQVTASTRDDKVIVRISDDGAGINVNAIKNRLLKNGTHTKTEVEAMPNSEIYAMIFSSGFSTAQQVTEISGRGVGMSMVKDCVEAIGGVIVIESKPGKGASFQLELPVPKSVLIANCLGFKIGSRRFSILQDDIVRVLQFTPHQAKEHIKDLQKSRCLEFDGELVPMVDLNDVLNLGQTASAQDDIRVLVLKAGKDQRRMAIMVSEILEVEDMVIKNIHATLNHNSFYRGVTFVDDGTVGLILNAAGLMQAAHIVRTRSRDLTGHAQAQENALAAHEKSAQKQALTVRLSEIGECAIAQETIYRIEELAVNEIQRSGRSFVVPYRGAILQVLDFTAQWLENDRSKLSEEKIRMVVFENQGKYKGLCVDDIFDMVPVTDVQTNLAQPEQFIAGHIFVGQKTVALLDIEGLLQRGHVTRDARGEVGGHPVEDKAALGNKSNHERKNHQTRAA